MDSSNAMQSDFHLKSDRVVYSFVSFQGLKKVQKDIETFEQKLKKRYNSSFFRNGELFGAIVEEDYFMV